MGPADWLILGASIPSLLFIGALGALLRTVRSVRRLADVPVPRRDAPPTVTALTPACDEEEAVEASVRSFLTQRDVAVDVVAIDDRSRDRTGAILDGLAAAEPRVTALRVDALPAGWLGKVHALDLGVRRATGDWLLFADADVRLAPHALARAVAYAETHGVDLLTAYPQIEPMGFFGDTVWSYIGCVAGLGVAPWKLRDRESGHVFSVGAFILVRRSAFDRTPGLSYIRLEVADDMGLGILMKDHGHRCDVVNGRGEVRLHWYTSFRDLVVRSQKNFFGIMSRFSLARAVAISAAMLWVGLTPVLLAIPASVPPVLVAPAIGLAAMLACSVLHARWAARPLFPSLFAPLGAVLLAFIVLRAAIVGVRTGGIVWRGVLYDGATLRDAQRFRM